MKAAVDRENYDKGNLTLHGYQYSVYTRVVAVALAEKALLFEYIEVDPFSAPSACYHELHPFGRVPVLDHAGFELYETTAITHYLDERFPAPSLQPSDIEHRSRMRQIISIIDNYAYWPLVRLVYARSVFGPAQGDAVDEAAISAGLERAWPVIAVLDAMAADHLRAERPTLADIHLAPMIAAFAASREGAALLDRFPHLSRWWQRIAERHSMVDTRSMLLTAPR